jgi:hypothetical protein
MKKLMIVMLFASTLQANEYSFICNELDKD